MTGPESETAVDTDAAGPGAPLTWGLLIATRDRLPELKTCVEHALRQSRLPVEVIVVDASADWQSHARAIGDLVAAQAGIRFTYLPAETPSLTVQRNQAIDRAEADILFLIDDDSFMYPDCAAEVMKVYEADREGRVQGLQTALASSMPGDAAVSLAGKQSAAGAAMERGRGRWILRHVFLMGATQVFLPYDGDYPRHEVPDAVRGLAVSPARLLHGARMTYRRAAIAATRFDPILRFYCPFEDLDASYRTSRLGCLVTAHDARLYHHTTTSGRMNRFRVTWLSLLNQAVLIRRHSAARERMRRAYRTLALRRLLAECLKDVLARRFDLPQGRGVFRALVGARRAFAMSDAELEAWYPAMQKRIVKGRGA